MTRASSDWAPLPLRLVLGGSFIYHGWPKLFSASMHQGFAANLQAMGIPAAATMAWVVGIVEVVGGLALVLGAFVAIAGALLIISQLVALFKVHLGAGYSFIHITGMTPTGPQFGLPGFEVNLVYIAGLLALVIGGAGAASVDRMRQRTVGQEMGAATRV